MSHRRFEVTALGEPLLRLSVPPGHRLESATGLDAVPGGAECNVVAALARLNHRCGWVGGLPRNPLGRLIANHLRGAGVDLGGVAWSDEGRLGTYYLEYAHPPRSTQAYYDRADSCTARLASKEIDWDYLLDTRLLYLSGITPALSPGCRDLVSEAIRRARERGVAIAFDINYRQKLWSAAEAAHVLRSMIQSVDLLLCSESDARRVLDCEGDPESIVERLHAMSHARWVIMSRGADGALGYDGTQLVHEPARPVTITDRIGAGDALAAGVLHGWLAADSRDSGALRTALRYGVTLAALALSQYGDAVITTHDELESLAGAEGGDIVR